jgi:hypothetical protein
MGDLAAVEAAPQRRSTRRTPAPASADESRESGAARNLGTGWRHAPAPNVCQQAEAAAAWLRALPSPARPGPPRASTAPPRPCAHRLLARARPPPPPPRPAASSTGYAPAPSPDVAAPATAAKARRGAAKAQTRAKPPAATLPARGGRGRAATSDTAPQADGDMHGAAGAAPEAAALDDGLTPYERERAALIARNREVRPPPPPLPPPGAPAPASAPHLHPLHCSARPKEPIIRPWLIGSHSVSLAAAAAHPRGTQGHGAAR